MQVIRNAQAALFEADALQKYTSQLRTVLRDYYREHLDWLGPEETDARIAHGVASAHRLGLADPTQTGMFVELTVLFGKGFESDEHTSWAAAILGAEPAAAPSERIGLLYEVGMQLADNPRMETDSELSGDA